MKKLLFPLLVTVCLAGIVLWQIFSDGTNYYLVSVLLIIATLVPFFASYENSNPSAREISLIASLIAVAVVSRAVFYLVPQVKPIGAVVAVSGVCLGAKKGYIVGSLSAFISNFIFGQGIWTPFQMVALGLVGFLSGVIFKYIRANKINLALSGFVLTFAVYGIVVDLCSVLMMSDDFSVSSVLAVYGAGVVFNLVFGVSTAVFMLLFGEAFVKKVNRLIKKYGIGGENNG